MGVFDASKLDKMKKAYRAGEFKKAYTYAEKLDPLSIKTVYDFSMLAEVYVKNHKYNAAKEIYIRIFEKNNSINVCKEIIKLCIKTKNVKEAIKYIKELNKIDPEDYERFIFQYKVGKLLDQPDEYLIECLKKVREADYIDKWALELARLYYANGMYDECRTECHNINLWFPESDYALKAEALVRNIEAGIRYADTVEKASYDERSSYDAPVRGVENGDEAAETGYTAYAGEAEGVEAWEGSYGEESESAEPEYAGFNEEGETGESVYDNYPENEYPEEDAQNYDDGFDNEADDFTVCFDEAGLWENYADDGEMTEIIPDEEESEEVLSDEGGSEETENGFEYDFSEDGNVEYNPEDDGEEPDGSVMNSEVSEEDVSFEDDGDGFSEDSEDWEDDEDGFSEDSEDWEDDGFLEDNEDWEDDEFLEDSVEWGEDDFLEEGDDDSFRADEEDSFVKEEEEVSESVDEETEEDSFEDSEDWEDDDFLADSEEWGDDGFLDEEEVEAAPLDLSDDSSAGEVEDSESEEFVFYDEEFSQEPDADYAVDEQAAASEEIVEEKENPVVEKASEVTGAGSEPKRPNVVDDWIDEEADDVNVYGGSNWAESLYEDSDDFAAAFDAERKNRAESLSDSVSKIMETDGDRVSEDDDFETTLVNDSLTHDVIRALREQEENGIVNGVDKVDESILKMIEE